MLVLARRRITVVGLVGPALVEAINHVADVVAIILARLIREPGLNEVGGQSQSVRGSHIFSCGQTRIKVVFLASSSYEVHHRES